MEKPPRKRMGRPVIPFTDKDYETVLGLMRIMCTAEEICDVMGISQDTLCRRLSERGAGTFAEIYKKNKAHGKASIRRAQYKLAVDQMNPTMLIWLGKNNLGQMDHQEVEVLKDNNFTITITDATRQPELEQLPA